jgi:outer membrane lipoprotein-sorting protein
MNDLRRTLFALPPETPDWMPPVPLKTLLRTLAFLLASVAILAACGGDDPGDLDEDVGVEEILENASQRLLDTETMAFRMSIDGSTYIDEAETLRLLNARGTMARPDRVDVEFQVEVIGTQRISIRMITIGDDSWTTDIVTGRWVVAQDEFGYNPAVLYDNQDGLGPVMGRMQDTEIVGTEEISNVEAYRIRGTVTDEVIEPLTAGTMDGSEITVELWVDGETWNIMRLTVAEPTDEGLDDPATWTMNLGEHDEQVTIERPD